MVFGDKFENISQSIIATRDSIAKGIITVTQADDPDVAEAIEKLEKAIVDADESQMPSKLKLESLELLDQITRQVSSQTKNRTILRALGESLWKIIRQVESVAKVGKIVWPFLEKLWS